MIACKENFYIIFDLSSIWRKSLFLVVFMGNYFHSSQARESIFLFFVLIRNKKFHLKPTRFVFLHLFMISSSLHLSFFLSLTALKFSQLVRDRHFFPWTLLNVQQSACLSTLQWLYNLTDSVSYTLIFSLKAFKTFLHSLQSWPFALIPRFCILNLLCLHSRLQLPNSELLTWIKKSYFYYQLLYFFG